MTIGLYGKLPAKRDFIAIGASRDFLLAWEAWIQGGVSASTIRLGPAWKPAFLKAPIWRFWLGAGICGETVIGAFMPSLDGVGRYFPLTVFLRSGSETPLPPPEIDPQSAWFEAAEDFLLSTLDEGMAFDTVLAGLQGLGAPAVASGPEGPAGPRRLTDGSVLVEGGEADFQAFFAVARIAGHADAYAGSSYWWTLGGEGFAATALGKRNMPDPFLFTGMITGDFK